MTKRSADEFFEMMTNPRFMVWCCVFVLAIITAIFVYDSWNL
jgi:hypothetical protein